MSSNFMAIKTVFVTCFVASIFISCSQQVENELQAPNVIFILVDDLGYGDLGCYNKESKIPTPNIDQLANQGVRFIDAHTPASVCVPSRYSLLTGQYHFKNKRDYKEGRIAPERITIASLMKNVGYNTAVFGKWHQGIPNEKSPVEGEELMNGPLDHGFDYFFGIPASLDIPPYYFIENKLPVEYPTDSIAGSPGTGLRKIEGPFYRGGNIAPDYSHGKVLGQITKKGVEYISGKAKEKNPFFMYLALPAPHTPWLPSKEFQGKSKAGMYGDYTMQVDAMIGQITDALRNAKIDENTIVFFSSDNGPVWWKDAVEKYDHSAVGKLAGMKGDSWEGGHRMPFIVKWPGIARPGSVNDKLISFTDVLATFAEMNQVSLTVNDREDSQSFLPLLKDNGHPATRETFIHQSSKRMFSIRKGNWKFIDGKGSGGFTDGYDPSVKTRDNFPGQLYNLENDLGEKTNLYELEKEKREELYNELKALTSVL
ncbi:arylsulfatase [Reichenbachiella sp. MALMAid0571]|uniref:sulfatase family protein n=1 Tax=Reichenbachiella sp. MALMAid0571 TaxID=3143939 RepID=UPI0032DF4BF5